MDVDNVCQTAAGRSDVFDNKKGANGFMGKIKVTPCDIKGLYVIEPAAVSYTHLTLPTNREV